MVSTHWTPMSFAFVGFVHACRGFDIFLSTALVLISLLGYYFPFILVLIYVELYWRVLAGSRITTDCTIYIGRLYRKPKYRKQAANYTDNKSCETLNDNSVILTAHWIVALDEGQDHFKVTHAVGNVLAGNGLKRPYKKKAKKEIHSKYRLYHVGWAMKQNRNEHMELVRDRQPIKFSGNTCQEYAIDIAFQLSCARTYTMVKSLFVPSLRTFIFLCLLIFSLLVEIMNVTLDTPVIIIVPIRTDVVNPITVINIYVALESYRFGYTNEPVKRTTRWYQELKNRKQHIYSRPMSAAERLKLFIVIVYLAIFYFCFIVTVMKGQI